MDSSETNIKDNKNFFTYSILQIEPKIENIFSVGEKVDIFFGSLPLCVGKHI
jgi:hypothetical protein